MYVDLNRIPPARGPEAYKTYSIRMPLATHWRPGTCEEASCPDHAFGWSTTVDESTDLGKRQAHFIRHDRTRAHTEEKQAAGLTVFTFAPGQTCFRQHRVPLWREAFYLVTGGDWRGNPRGDRYTHVSADDWVDDFANHQDRIAEAVRRG